MYVIVGLFEVHDTMRFSMVKQLQALFEKFDLMHCVVAFVKNESNNLTFMATTQHFVVYCHPLKLQLIYEGFCFGHVMSKAYQCATNDDKVNVGLKHVNVNNAQTSLR
jgi:hypothetical protein